jgi:hypothetical protein
MMYAKKKGGGKRTGENDDVILSASDASNVFGTEVEGCRPDGTRS